MKKVFKIVIITLAVLFALLLTLPFIFKGKIVELIKKEANKQLTAKLDFNNDIGLSLIKNFPNFTLELNDLSIADTADVERDSLISVKKFRATLDIMSVIKGDKIEVKSILLENPRIYAKVGKDGKANWDIMKPSTDTTAAKPEDTTSNFKLGLQKLEIKDGVIVYDDREGDMYMALLGVNHTLKGDFTADVSDMETMTTAEAVTFGMEGMNYLTKVKAQLKADILADLKNFKFTFKDNELQLNELFVGFDGFFAMPGDDMLMDIKFASRKTDFKNILSLVPVVYTKDFANVKTSGKLALAGYVKGTYNETTIPGFDVKLNIEDGMFQYPSMPVSMNKIFVDLNVNNPDGVMDNTVIDLKKLDFIMAGEPFHARALVKNPTTDPLIDMEARGKVNLGNVASLIPLEKGTKLAGLISADMAAKGRVSAAEKADFGNFTASGQVEATNVLYDTDSLPETTISTARLLFNPQTVEMPAFNAKIGNSDLNMTASLRNFFGYFAGNQTLSGNLNINSNFFDANQFISPNPSEKTAPEPKDTVPMEVVEVPENIDFTLKLDIKKFLYDNLVFDNMGGTTRVADETITLDNLHTNLLGGGVRMDGSYSTKSVLPEARFKFSVAAIDAGEVFKYITTVKQLAPIAQYITGKISTDFDLYTQLDKHMKPVLPSITSTGKLDIPKASLSGYPAQIKLAEALNMEKLKQLDLNRILLQFSILNGRVALQPFNVKTLGTNMEISGSSGLDRTLDYTIKMDVPRSLFGSANTALDKLMGEVNKKGIDLKPNEVIKVNVLVGGTTSNPVIKTSLKELAKSALGDVKDAAMQKLEEEKQKAIEKVDAELQKRIAEASAAGDRLIADAQKRADAAKAEARKQADAVLAEANKQADEKVKLAGNNPIAKKAAEKVAEKLKAEARTKADKIIADGDAKADATVNEARQKKEQMIKDAEAGKNNTLGR